VLSVLLVDDHPIVRHGLGRLLTTEFPEMRIAEAEDGRHAIERLRRNVFDLVLLDLTLPGDHGLTLLRRLRRDFESIPIVVVSMHPVDQFAQRALIAGAAGYVAKDSDPRELVEAIRTVLAGGRHVPVEVQEAFRQQGPPLPHEALSDREYQVLRLIGAGRTVSQISQELTLSVKTVSTYRARILEKLHLRTSAELIHYAVVHKLVS
jgi:DNA-binding NarL/FixJ family response regulator